MSQKSNPTPASLRECPFCGGHAVLEEYTVRKGFEAQVVCNGWCPDSHVRTITYETQAEANAVATTRWNTRPEPPAVRCAGNEELREALTEAIQAMKLASSTLIHANKHGLGTVPLADNLWTKAELLEAALAHVPQPPAGNEEALRVAALSALAILVKAQRGLDLYRSSDLPAVLTQLEAALQAPQPAPATGTVCKNCGGTGRDLRFAEQGSTADDCPPCPACNGTGKATACVCAETGSRNCPVHQNEEATACPHGPHDKYKDTGRCVHGCGYEFVVATVHGPECPHDCKPCPVHGHGKREER